MFLYALNGISREDTAVYNCGDLRRKNVRLGRSGKHRRNDGGVEHRVEGWIFLKVRNKLFQILIRFLKQLCQLRIFLRHIRRKDLEAASDRIRHAIWHRILLDRDQCLCNHGRREILARAAGVSAFCGVGEFKVHISFFAESDRAECLVIDPVVASRADSAAFIENSTEADSGPSEGLRRDLSACDLFHVSVGKVKVIVRLVAFFQKCLNGFQLSDQVALAVTGSAAPDLSIGDGSGVWRICPLFKVAFRDNVLMRH